MNSLNRDTKPKAKPNGWEEEFDKKFPFRGLTDGDYYTMTDIKDFIHQAILSAEDNMRKRCVEEAEKRYRYTIEILEVQNKLLLERLQLKHLSEPMVFQVTDQATQNIKELEKKI